MQLPVNRTFGDLSWYSIDKERDTVTVTTSEAKGGSAVRLSMGWTDAVRFAHDILAVALEGEPILDRP